MKEFTSKELWDGRLVVISVQKMRGRKGLAPCVLIRKRNGMLLYGSYHYDRYHRRTARFRSPTICFTAIEAVEEGDVIGIINHKGNLETYVVKGGQLVPHPSVSQDLWREAVKAAG